MVTTKVAFRKFENGEVVAIFTDTVEAQRKLGDKMYVPCESYMHIGQHAPCDPRLLDELEKCSEEEYAPLLLELECLGYEVEVVD